MRQVALSLTVVLGLLLASRAISAELEFEGTPETKVEVLEGVAKSTKIPPLEATGLRVVIVRDGDSYIWKSRDGIALSKSTSGAYITYTAINGAGYIRVLSPAMRELRERLPPAERDAALVYAEHLVHQLGSLTYFGK